MGFKFNPLTSQLDLVGSGSSATTPGGTNTQVQYNNAGSFGGFGAYDGTTFTLSRIAATTSLITPLVKAEPSGTLLVMANDSSAGVEILSGFVGVFSSTATAFFDTTPLTNDRLFAFPDTAGTIALTSYVASGTVTLTNKRITKRVATITQSATPTSNTNNADVFSMTGLAAAVTNMSTNQTGTPVAGDTLIWEITDNGTARALSWGGLYEASTVPLPTTTVISTLLTVGFRWNTVTSKWRCVAVA